MRKNHHQIIGIPKISTSKVHKIYTYEPYRKSTYKTNPPEDFVENYLNLIISKNNKEQMLEDLKTFYVKVKHNIELRKNYRIPIKNTKRLYTLQNPNKIISSSVIARLDKENATTTTDISEVSQLSSNLKNIYNAFNDKSHLGILKSKLV